MYLIFGVGAGASDLAGGPDGGSGIRLAKFHRHHLRKKIFW